MYGTQWVVNVKVVVKTVVHNVLSEMWSVYIVASMREIGCQVTEGETLWLYEKVSTRWR